MSETSTVFSDIGTIISTRQETHHVGAPGVNTHNLKTLALNCRKQWDFPSVLSLNARSLSIEKSDELQEVVYLNRVTCVCVTETWFKDYMDNASVNILGFNCERRDRLNKRGGGVACYIHETVHYNRLSDLDDAVHEVVWVRLQPKKLPRQFSCIIIACIYHPPDSDNISMRDYLITCMDTILRKHPNCGVILTGDFNQLRDDFLRTHYKYKQLVNKPTRLNAILDKLWTNMSAVYDSPEVLDELGASDHRMVLLSTTGHPSLDTGSVQHVITRCMGHTERAMFASALSRVRWEPLYHLPTCQEQFEYFQGLHPSLKTSQPWE